MCEGVGRDSGCGHEESHLMHVMNIPYRITSFMWIVVGGLCMSLHVHFRWGVALVGKFLSWALLTPSWVNTFKALEVRPEVSILEDYREKAGLWSVPHFVLFWAKDPAL